MGQWGFGFLILLSTWVNASEPMSYFLVPQENLGIAQTIPGVQIVERAEGAALVRLSDSQVLQFSGKLHEAKNICGGFIALDSDSVSTESEVRTQFRTLYSAHYEVQSLGHAFAGVFPRNSTQYSKEVNQVLSLLDKAKLKSSIEALQALGSRNSKTDKGVAAVTFMENKIKDVSTGRQDVSVRRVATGGSYIMDSLVVKIAGKDSNLPSVVIGGHLDSVNHIVPGNEPGADDDGSGSSTVLETFRAILASKLKFNRDLYFMFYGAEEYGLYGSQKVVADFSKNNIPVLAVGQFDMTGYKSPNDSREMYFISDNVDPGLTAFMKKLATTYLGLTESQLGETACGYGCSDHYPWTLGGIAAAMPSEASFQNINRRFHTVDDKIDVLNMDHAMKFLKIAAAFSVELAEPVATEVPPPGPSATPSSGSGKLDFQRKSFTQRGASCGLVDAGDSQMSRWGLLLFLLPVMIWLLARVNLPRAAFQTVSLASLAFVLLVYYQNCTRVQTKWSPYVPKNIFKR